MSDETYRKIGRGGAGNFYHAKSSDSDSTSKDLAAQEITDPAAAIQPNHAPSAPVHAGRGGAGNYVDASSSAAEEQERIIAEKTVAAMKHHPHRSGGGLSGRGGAGNWNTDASPSRDEDASGEKEAGMEQKIKEVVEQGLKMPEKVHHAMEKHKGQ